MAQKSQLWPPDFDLKPDDDVPLWVIVGGVTSGGPQTFIEGRHAHRGSRLRLDDGTKLEITELSFGSNRLVNGALAKILN